MKWVYEPVPTPASQGVACCDVVNRGAAYDDGKIYYNTLDNQTVAVRRRPPGREVWKTRVGDINKGESMTMAPLVVKGESPRRKQWRANSEFGGWLTALDGKTGKIAWRAYTAGPDKDVIIGPAFQTVLLTGSRPGSWSEDLAAGRMENWRRWGVGMDFV